MRHYLWHDAAGEIKGHSRNLGGFTGDPRDPDDPSTEAQDLRAFFMGVHGYTGCVAFDCACAQGDENCACSAEALKGKYFDGSAVADKPTLTVEIDGVGQPTFAVVDKTPGATATLKLVGAGVPDGHQVTLRRSGVADLTTSDPVLTFTSGETNVVNLTAPAQGLKGSLHGVSKWCCHVAFTIRGWA